MMIRNACVFAVCCALTVFLGGEQHVMAQPAYSFELMPPGVSTYQELSNDKLVTFDTNGFYQLPFQEARVQMLFNVQFSMREDASMHLGEGGFIRLDNDSAMVIIDGAFTYLDSIDETSRVSYVVEGGSSTERILKYQYKHHKLRAGPDGNFMNMQIWCYDSTGVIEMHYGPRSENNASGYTAATGPNVGVFFARSDFSRMIDKLWLNGDPNAPSLDSVRNLNFRALSGVPNEGTVYRFIPRRSTVGVNEAVQTDAAFVGHVDVYDLFGRLMGQYTMNGNKNDYAQLMRDLPHGSYVVRLTTQTKTITQLIMH